ncbi:glycoside hydrolase family 43 protein [Bifidobacterium amazonense]|uniref:Glycoside hydrolase family 43 protein n=1 Tax=Bifidobacterium amazonense TaxID=2809027 RepID=A0ABS9VSB3_9BIFI|nr:glycoside hydrolase family 43 protein [Bifidobacterium amazonense]MCH9274804.1 glycoside hydrolase family 43 protein [Bifidobacterium amazonense]
MKSSLARRVIAAAIVVIAAVAPLAGCSATAADGSKPVVSKVSDIKRASSHDPTIAKDGDTYYIYGSHRAWYKSTDLVNWEPFTDNLSTDFKDILGGIWKEWPQQPSNSDLTGNMWAPEVVYNKTMKKWCMYMSVNGTNYKSVIVLLTADHLGGDWTYVGPVVYSGFRTETMDKTDVGKVLGTDEVPTRYLSPGDTEINAIDPSVETDDNGDMWMTFGSWFGGLWMFKLDPATGLRDYKTTYQTVTDKSDQYYGIKLAGGYGNSGEGSYLLHTNGYWYLFASYGALQQTGGYQIRMFRSKDITGPYVDENGNPAVYTGSVASNWTSDIGVRLMASVKWSGNDNTNIEVAQGGNSAFVDSDGTAYIIYHTRFSNRGEEHEVRVRELLPTSDGWIVAAPYEYTGVKAATKGYDKSRLAGDYELVTHAQNTFFQGKKNIADQDSTDYIGVNEAVNITLKSDGTVTGDQTGTWSVKDGSDQMSITLDGTEYQGVFDLLPRDKDLKQVMTFSAIGNNLCIWGSQK